MTRDVFSARGQLLLQKPRNMEVPGSQSDCGFVSPQGLRKRPSIFGLTHQSLEDCGKDLIERLD